MADIFETIGDLFNPNKNAAAIAAATTDLANPRKYLRRLPHGVSPISGQKELSNGDKLIITGRSEEMYDMQPSGSSSYRGEAKYLDTVMLKKQDGTLTDVTELILDFNNEEDLLELCN